MTRRILTKRTFRLADCGHYNTNDTIVQPGLSLTPRDVKQLTDRGMAVSTRNIGTVSDPDLTPGYLPPEYRRGCDINTAWESSRNANNGLIDHYKYSKRIKSE